MRPPSSLALLSLALPLTWLAACSRVDTKIESQHDPGESGESGGGTVTVEGSVAASKRVSVARGSVSGPLPAQPTEKAGARPPIGGPLDGLTEAELAAFERGRIVFERRFNPSEGLGPRYNATSCVSCHSTPEVGGSAELYRNFYVGMEGPTFFQHPIPPLESLVIPAFGKGKAFSLEKKRFTLQPPIGGIPIYVAQRNPIPMFGTGLFEFVSNATIVGMADPEDADGDGISGRYNRDTTGAIGRFGTKAQSNSIEVFTRTPLKTQMGITTDPFLGSAGAISLSAAAVQAAGDPNEPTTDDDGVPDPEMSRQDLGDLIAFSRFLAPVGKKLPFSDEATRGETLFATIGCTSCHVPSLPSSRGPVEAYTDLLLHDMGPGLADNLAIGLPQPSFSSPSHNGSEWRTQPLWGVSLHAPYLHDGRAETLHEAVSLHGGEGAAARDLYMALSASDQNDVIEFLRHL